VLPRDNLRELYGIDISSDLASVVTDADEVGRDCCLAGLASGAVFPLVFFDALRVMNELRNPRVEGISLAVVRGVEELSARSSSGIATLWSKHASFTCSPAARQPRLRLPRGAQFFTGGPEEYLSRPRCRCRRGRSWGLRGRALGPSLSGDRTKWAPRLDRGHSYSIRHRKFEAGPAWN